MSAVDSVWNRSLAVALEGEGRNDKYAVEMLQDFCRKLVLERAFLLTNPESAAVDIVNATCEKLTQVVPRERAMKSRGLFGEVEFPSLIRQPDMATFPRTLPPGKGI